MAEGFLINLLAHYPCYRRTINSTRTLLGDCVTSSDHVVIYGINLGFDHELKILSCPEPEYCLMLTNMNISSKPCRCVDGGVGGG